ncbi:Asp-tRNA(Asn)/Glu-tRNA(Gln) amidotransferase subunit GatC [Elusimicrobiota bacterium]
MKISKKDVDYVATLARLEFETKEEEKLTGQLESILGYVDKIKEVDTSKIEPTSHGFTGENVWREDIVVKSDSKTIDSLFKNAPAKDGTFFKVEKVIDSED